MNSGDIVNEILDIAQNSSKMPGFGSKVLVDVDRLEAVASRLLSLLLLTILKLLKF